MGLWQYPAMSSTETNPPSEFAGEKAANSAAEAPRFTSQPMQLLCLALLLALSAYLVSLGIARSINLDETWTIYLSKYSFSELYSRLAHDAHPPLYFFLLKVWTHLVGIAEAPTRSLSALFYLLSIASCYFLVRALRGHYVAIFTSLLLALSPLSIDVGKSARMYSLLLLLSVISCCLFLHIFVERRDSKWMRIAYVLGNALGTFTHYWFFFLLFGQGIALLATKARKQIVLFSLFGTASVIPFSVLWLPNFLHQLKGTPSAWISEILPGVFEAIYQTFGAYYGGREAFVLLAVIVLSSLIAVRSAHSNSLQWKKLRFSIQAPPLHDIAECVKTPLVVSLLIIFITSVGTPFVLSYIRPMFFARYTVVALLPFTLLLALFLDRFTFRPLAVLLLISLACTVTAKLTWAEKRPDQQKERAVAEYVLANIADGDVVIAGTMNVATMQYHLLRQGRETAVEVHAFPEEIELHPTWRDLKGMIAREDEMRAEAKALVEKLVKANRIRVWLLAGYDEEVIAWLEAELEKYFDRVSEKRFEGIWKRRVAEWQRKS